MEKGTEKMKTAEEEHQEFLASLRADLEKIRPKPKPKLTVASETSLPLRTQARRLAQSQQQLMQNERDRVEDERDRREAERDAREARQLEYQLMVDRWVESKREIERHERWLKRKLDPDGWGIYEVGSFHGSEKDYRR